jgi:hypothetical protein
MFYEDRGRVLNTYYSNGEFKENLSRAKVSNALICLGSSRGKSTEDDR